MSTLEDRYRRLLAWYPRDHRAAHEDEMVGVLLAGAATGQYKPTAGERADLLWGGLNLHARRAFGRRSGPVWRDALAVAGTVGTMVFLVQAVTSAALASVAGYWVPARFVDVLLIVVVAVGVGTNQRWVAAPVAWLLWLNQLPWIGWDTVGAAGPFAIDGWMALLAGTAAALTLSGEPRRGVRLAGPRRLLPWAALLAAVMVVEALMTWFGRSPDPALAALPIVATCAIACGSALRSRVGRRCVVILGLPVAHGLMAGQAQPVGAPGWLVAGLLGLAIALLAGFGRTIGRQGSAAAT